MFAVVQVEVKGRGKEEERERENKGLEVFAPDSHDFDFVERELAVKPNTDEYAR